MSSEATGRPSTPALFADALSQITTLFETEIRLVRTELSEKISMAVRAVVIMLAAAVLLLTAVFLLLIGVVEILIALGLAAWLACFVVGIVIAICAGIAIYFALKQLSADNLAPRRSFSQLGKDANVVKEQVR